jgi:prophage DNA circulation protein
VPSFKDLVWESTYRRLPFVILACRVRSGRRLERHQVAAREYPLWEDQGREPWKLDVQGLVIGDDVLTKKAALQRASEAKGPGDLYTPYTGLVPVRCTAFEFSEQTDELRVARFTASFEEDREPGRTETTVVRSTAELANSATALEEASTAELVATLDSEGPEVVREAPASVIRSLANKMRELNSLAGLSADIAQAVDLLDLLVTSASALVTAPADLASDLLQAIEHLGTYQAAPGGALFAYRSLFDEPEPEVPGSGATALQALQNATAVADLGRDGALAGWALAAAGFEWETLEQALAERDDLLEAIDERSDLVRGSDVLVALGALRAAVVASLPPPDRALPRVKTVQLAGATNALALAYELYGAPDAAEEIVARNHARNPLFLTGAVQVLSEA